ncbi:MAG: Fur family transcriptional regulator, ferric uptake regulator [Actinomycetota bacterium]|nr:Fur family transcriptional regulator, ferric uptake regulator [Actinomycetota bacterium]
MGQKRSSALTNMRSTRQRTAILELLKDADSFLGAQEMYDALRDKGMTVGLTTVYRNLQMMADVNEVDVVRREDGELMFRRCRAEDHHHHLVCRSCGYTVELANDQLESWASSLARKHRFSEVTHDLELFGLCDSCTPQS